MTSILVALLLVSAPADELKYMPKGTAYQLKIEATQEMVRYYRLEEYKLLMKMDFDLQEAERKLEIYKDLDLKYTSILKLKDEVIKTLQEDTKVKDARLKRVEDLWHKAEKEAVDNAGGPIWPYIVGGVGAVVGIVGATLYISTLVK